MPGPQREKQRRNSENGRHEGGFAPPVKRSRDPGWPFRRTIHCITKLFESPSGADFMDQICAASI